MKKVLFTFLVFSISLTINAQSDGGSFGLKAGVNLYKISGEDYDDPIFKRRTALHAGIFYQLPVGTLFRIQPELLYSGEGIKLEDEDIEAKIIFNYLNVPVMFQVHTPIGLFFETGPQVGFLLNAKVKYKEDGDEYEEKMEDEMRKTSFSWGAGAGYMFGNFGIGARYNFGLSKLPKDDDQDDDKSSGFQISLIWRLRK
jgi:hypothetical protein